MDKTCIESDKLANSLNFITGFQHKMKRQDHSTLNQHLLQHGPFSITYDGKDYWYEGCDIVWQYMELKSKT